MGPTIDREGVVPGEVCEPPDWALAHTVTVDEALRMMTVDAAYAIGLESSLAAVDVPRR